MPSTCHFLLYPYIDVTSLVNVLKRFIHRIISINPEEGPGPPLLSDTKFFLGSYTKTQTKGQVRAVMPFPNNDLFPKPVAYAVANRKFHAAFASGSGIPLLQRQI